MPSFTPQHTGQFVVRPRFLRRQQRVVRVVLVAALLLLPYVTFESGRWLAGYSVRDAVQQKLNYEAQLDGLHQQLEQAQRDLNANKLELQVTQQAAKDSAATLAQLQAEQLAQQEELAFYRGIVKPEGQNLSPSVQRIEVSQMADRQYTLRLVLIQPAQLTNQAQGQVQLSVEGRRQGQLVRLPLSQLAAGAADSLKFSYRYFQHLEQPIVLPTDFEPQTLLTELRAGQYPVQQQSFPWKLSR